MVRQNVAVQSRGSVENQQLVDALAVRLAEQQQLQNALAQLGLGVPYNSLLQQQQQFGGVQPYQSGTAGYVSGQDPFRRPADERQADLVDRQQRTAERLLELQEAIAQANLDRIEEMKEARRPDPPLPDPAADSRRSVLVDAAESCARCHNPDKKAGGLVLDGSERISDETLQKAINALVDGRMPKTPAGNSVPLEGEQLSKALHRIAKLAQ